MQCRILNVTKISQQFSVHNHKRNSKSNKENKTNIIWLALYLSAWWTMYYGDIFYVYVSMIWYNRQFIWAGIFDQSHHPCLFFFLRIFYLFIWLYWVLVAACGILFPDQGLNLGLLNWECTVLATGSPEQSPIPAFDSGRISGIDLQCGVYIHIYIYIGLPGS